VARPNRLTDVEIGAGLAQLDGWTREGEKLHRSYRFADFVTAFGFMASVALIAERMNHHPEWSNVWSAVTVDLSTHDAGGITALDLDLARAMESLAGRLPQAG